MVHESHSDGRFHTVALIIVIGCLISIGFLVLLLFQKNAEIEHLERIMAEDDTRIRLTDKKIKDLFNENDALIIELTETREELEFAHSFIPECPVCQGTSTMDTVGEQTIDVSTSESKDTSEDTL